MKLFKLHFQVSKNFSYTEKFFDTCFIAISIVILHNIKLSTLHDEEVL